MKKTILALVVLGSAALGLTSAATAAPVSGSLLGATIGQARISAQYVDVRRYGRRHARRARLGLT